MKTRITLPLIIGFFLATIAVSASAATLPPSHTPSHPFSRPAMVSGTISAVNGSDITIVEESHVNPKGVSGKGLSKSKQTISSSPTSVVVHTAHANVDGFKIIKTLTKKKGSGTKSTLALTVGERVDIMGKSQSDGSIDAEHVMVLPPPDGVPKTK